MSGDERATYVIAALIVGVIVFTILEIKSCEVERAGICNEMGGSYRSDTCHQPGPRKDDK